MSMPKILSFIEEYMVKVATNTTNIAKNTSDINANKSVSDSHIKDDERHWTTEDRQKFDRVNHFKGYFISLDKLKETYSVGQVGDYAIVGGTDTVWVWDDATNNWLNSSQQGVVVSVNGRTGEVILTKTDVGLSNIDNTSDINKPISKAQQTALDNKVNKKQITLADAESLELDSGIYYISGENKTINDFTDNYWEIIACGASLQGGIKSVSQIWMNYSSTKTPHIYFRKQENYTSWCDFREIMTNANLALLQDGINVNTTNIATNTKDIATNKANIVTNTTNIATNKKNIETNTNNIKVNTTNIATNKTNIATNTSAIATNKTAIDANTKNIATNKTNIATNTTNITTNTTNITNLQNGKSARQNATLSQLNGMGLRSGIYSLNDVSVTINGYSSSFWNVYVGEATNQKSASQIWISFATENNTVCKIFIRHQLNTETKWGNFYEILTTNNISLDSLNKINNYKGYFATESALTTGIPTGINGDYAIVGDGSAFYIWDSTSKTWIKASGANSGSGEIDASELAKKLNKAGDTMSGQLNVAYNIDSTSTTTGAILTAGGMGVAKTLNVGGNINSNGDINSNNGVISFKNNAASIKYNSTDECFEFIFS